MPSDLQVPTSPAAYPFQTEIRVRLSETDAVGIVYFGSFSTYMDVGRMDFLNHLGLQHSFGHLGGPVRHLPPGAVVAAQVEFHSPARYNDCLAVHVRVAELGRSSYTFHFLITDKRAPRIVATGRLVLVWLDAAFRPTAMPDEFRSAIETYQQAAARLGGGEP